MAVIVTRFIGPTHFNGPRIKAYNDNGKSIIVPWRDDLDIDDNHLMAADALMQKLELPEKAWVSGWHRGEKFFISYSPPKLD